MKIMKILKIQCENNENPKNQELHVRINKKKKHRTYLENYLFLKILEFQLRVMKIIKNH